MLQGELKAAKPELNIEILGVNRLDESQNNHLATAMRILPWLQDTAQESVWTDWEVVYRDVRILDAQNRTRSVFNLTSHDLSLPSNYATLKQLFLDAARVVDSDGDRLPDDWEQLNFGTLAPGVADDPDGDGRDNFTEFAFGTNPTDAGSFLSTRASITFNGTDDYLTMSFRRPAGSILDYVIEASSDMSVWTQDPLELGVGRNPSRYFDGTGTIEVLCSLGKATSVRQSGFIRVRALPKPQQ